MQKKSTILPLIHRGTIGRIFDTVCVISFAWPVAPSLVTLCFSHLTRAQRSLRMSKVRRKRFASLMSCDFFLHLSNQDRVLSCSPFECLPSSKALAISSSPTTAEQTSVSLGGALQSNRTQRRTWSADVFDVDVARQALEAGSHSLENSRNRKSVLNVSTRRCSCCRRCWSQCCRRFSVQPVGSLGINNGCDGD